MSLNSIKGFLLTFTNQMSRALLDWDVTRNPKMALQPWFCKLWFFAINIQLPFHFNWKVISYNFFLLFLFIFFSFFFSSYLLCSTCLPPFLPPHSPTSCLKQPLLVFHSFLISFFLSFLVLWIPKSKYVWNEWLCSVCYQHSLMSLCPCVPSFCTEDSLSY